MPAHIAYAVTSKLVYRPTELPGDDLRDQPRDYLRQFAAAAAQASATRYPAAVTCVDTDSRDPAEIADGIAVTAFRPCR